MWLEEYKIILVVMWYTILDRISAIFKIKGPSPENLPDITADPGTQSTTGFFKKRAAIIGRIIRSPPKKNIHISTSLLSLRT